MDEMNEKRPDAPLAGLVATEVVTAQAVPDADATGPPKKGIPPIAEALGYIGGALALAAIIAFVFTFWAKIGLVGHVSVGLLVAVAGLVGGFVLRRSEGPAAKRLAHFLLLAGVAGVGFAAGFAVRDALFVYVASSFTRAEAAEWGWFAGALAVAIAGGLVYWREHSILQHLAFGVGVAGAALLALPLIPIEGPDWGAGATLVAVGLVWGALSLRDLIPPRTEGLVLSALGISGGILMMSVFTEPALVWAMWLGVATCAALIWAGSRLEELGVLGIGTAGLMVFSAQLVGEYLGYGAGTAIALIGIGFVLLGISVRGALREKPDASQDRRVATEAAGYLGVGLALGGAGILLVQYWDELAVTGHILVPAIGAVVAYVSATLLTRSETGSARRLSQTLYAIGVLGVGITAAMVAQPIVENIFPKPSVSVADLTGPWIMLAAAVAATIAGGVTYRWRTGSLTQIAFMGGLVVLVISAVNFNEAYGQQLRGEAFAPMWAIAAVLVALGTLWVALGASEHLPPTRTALAVGSYVTLQGLQMMSQNDAGLFLPGALLGIAYSVAAIVASIRLKRAILLGFGAIGVMMFTTITVMEEFAGTVGAPIALLIMGVIFIAMAVVVAKVAPRLRRTPKSTNAPKTPSTPSGVAPST